MEPDHNSSPGAVPTSDRGRLRRPADYADAVIKLFEDEAQAEKTAHEIIALVRSHSGVDAADLQWRVRELILGLMERCSDAESGGNA